MRRYLLIMILLCLQWAAAAQMVHQYRYWFDNDDANMHYGAFEGNSLNLDLDLSSLSFSLHYVNFQVKDTLGIWSSPVTRRFYKSNESEIATACYWFNDDYAGKVSVAPDKRTFSIDISALGETLNFFNYQVGDAFGVMSSPVSRMFIKIPQIVNSDGFICICFIDDKFYKEEIIASSDGVIDWSFDVSSLEHGLHKIEVQVLTKSGAASAVYNQFFFRNAMGKELECMRLLYSIDGGAPVEVPGNFAQGGYSFELNVDSVPDGLHTLSYMMVGDNELSSQVKTEFFVKTPLGGNGVTGYEYWLNGGEKDSEIVKLSQNENPFSMVSFIPVDSCPVRGTCFHFEEKRGVPMVFAKNDIYFRFFDVYNRSVVTGRQYVDYNVGDTIMDITLIESGKSYYKAISDNNDINWFKLNADRGDSIAFKTDVPALLNVFNADGDILYTTSGAVAKVFGGPVVDTTDVYYVAVSGVNTADAEGVTLNYVKVGPPVGDVDCDRVVDIADVTSLVSMILNPSLATKTADVNGDGIIDVADVTALIEIILNAVSYPGGYEADFMLYE